MKRSGIKVMSKLIGLIKPLMHIMILAIITGVLGYLSAIFITIFGGYAILNVLNLDGGFNYKIIFIIIIILGISRGILRYIEQLSNHHIAFKLLAIIRNKVFKALRRLSPAKLEGKDKGNLIALITSDVELLEVFYAHTISPIAIGFLTSLIMVIFIAHYNLILGIIALVAYVFVGVGIPFFTSKIGTEVGLKYRNLFGSLNSFILDSLRGLKEVIQYKKGDEKIAQLNDRSNELSTENQKLKSYEGLTKAVSDFSVFFFSSIMLVVGIVLYNKMIIGLDAVLITTIAMLSSFGPVLALSSLSNNLRHTIASGNRVLDLLDEEPIVKDVYDGIDVNYQTLNINNVDFTYDEEQILNNYSLDISQNAIVGIHGKSGVGKSTILKLIMRFWDVDNGSIIINGENIKNINTKSLRDNQSFITQETYLFNDTIANNIKLGHDKASLEEIIVAAKKASIHEFIMTLPKEYDTLVGELGDNLSSGEKQRIGIARIFLHDAPLILLDEPTSNLDSLNEGTILKSLAVESKNKTMIIISHRKSSMRICDVIYEMDSDRKS